MTPAELHRHHAALETLRDMEVVQHVPPAERPDPGALLAHHMKVVPFALFRTFQTPRELAPVLAFPGRTGITC